MLRFDRTCIYHLLCVGVILFFFSSLHAGNSNALFLWTPIGTHIGILAAVGLQECASMISWRTVRGLLLSFLEGLRVLMGAEEVRLPRFERGRQTPSPYDLTNTLIGPEWDESQNSSSSMPTFLAAYQRNDLTPNDQSETNPWRWHLRPMFFLSWGAISPNSQLPAQRRFPWLSCPGPRFVLLESCRLLIREFLGEKLGRVELNLSLFFEIRKTSGRWIAYLHQFPSSCKTAVRAWW